MKILMLCDHYPLSPRVLKMRESLARLYPNSIIIIYAWNRSNLKVREEYVASYNQEIGYGKKIGKIINLLKFSRAVKRYIKKFQPTHIHSIDLEMLIVAATSSKKNKLIYEVYDIKFIKNKILNFLKEKIEMRLIKGRKAKIIFASPFFKNYYSEFYSEYTEEITINNKPSNLVINSKKINYMEKFKAEYEGKLVIGFIGTIRHKKILINLINASKKMDNVLILLAGTGPSLEEVETYVNKNSLKSKVIFTGRYNSDNLSEIYEVCDFIWAAYPNNNLNVKYAVSNKFFESIVFNKKIIVSNLTILGNQVSKMNNGYVVDPYNVNEIENLLISLKKDDIPNAQMSFGTGLFWEDEEILISTIYN